MFSHIWIFFQKIIKKTQFTGLNFWIKIEVSSWKRMCIVQYYFVKIFMFFFSRYFSSRLPISDSKRSSMSGLMTSLSTIKRILCAWAKWEFGQHYPVELLGRRRRGLASVSVGLWSFYQRDKNFIFSNRWWKLKNSYYKVDYAFF